MALVPAREICRITTTYTSELGRLVWAWVMRADGTVLYQLIRVDGKRERNPWQTVRRLSEAERRQIGTDQNRAAGLLTRLAQERGHFPAER